MSTRRDGHIPAGELRQADKRRHTNTYTLTHMDTHASKIRHAHTYYSPHAPTRTHMDTHTHAHKYGPHAQARTPVCVCVCVRVDVMRECVPHCAQPATHTVECRWVVISITVYSQFPLFKS